MDQALEEQGLVVVRETDLDAIPQFLSTRKTGRLHVFIDEMTTDFEVEVGMLRTGEYLLPWRADSITDVLTNGQTHLVLNDKTVFFSNARELFYGEVKAFIACTPSAT